MDGFRVSALREMAACPQDPQIKPIITIQTSKFQLSIIEMEVLFYPFSPPREVSFRARV